MTVRVGKINGKKLNYTDNDNSSLDYALLKTGAVVIEGLEVTTGNVAVGRAILITRRESVSPYQKFGVHVEITQAESIDTTGTKKVWIALDPEYVDDGTIATEALGTQLAEIVTGASYPADNAFYIPLASITGGVITDERNFIRPLRTKGDNIALSGTVNLKTATGNAINITAGTGPITSFGTVQAGESFKLTFDVVATITYNATSMKLPRGENFTTAIGDVLEFQSEGSGNWKLVSYSLASGLPMYVATPSDPTPPALYDSTYPNGEDLTVGNVVFIEPSATFAQATSVQNIGDVAGNTRVSLPCFGAGVSATTQKLSLKKFVSPSVSLGIRIETDDGSGNPSGTLAHANATATVTAGSLTTSLADTTITFAGAFTLTAGQKYHIVLFQGTYGAETINGTNYYGLGYYTNNSTTRNSKKYNGSVWAATYSSVGSTNKSLAGSSQQNASFTAPAGLKYIAVKDVIINNITKSANTLATKAYIKNSAGTILDTMTFSGNVATPTTVLTFTAGTYFRVEVDSNGASYNNYREQSPTTYPQVGTDISITSNSLSGADDPVGNQNNSVLTINTGVATLVPIFPYSSSSLFYDAVLSKTCALFSYKIDWHGIASETKTVGQFPKIVISGIDSNQTGRTLGATQYLSDTAGAISGSAGTNSKKIGKATSATKIKIIDIPL